MPSKLGMSVTSLELGPVDHVHVLRSHELVWLQLRRNIPGSRELANPSYKVAVPLSAEQAVKLSDMLASAAAKLKEPKRSNRKGA
jgi:hypothetical protein